jgi:hypothetical protein
VLDLHEFLHPDLQIIGEHDWSSGHPKTQNLALNSASVNKSWGSSQPKMRTSESLDGHCVGTAEANVRHDGKSPRRWSLPEKPGWTKVDCHVHPGDKHVAVFGEDDPPPPPFMNWMRRCMAENKPRKKRTRSKQKEKARQAKKAGRGRGRGREKWCWSWSRPD